MLRIRLHPNEKQRLLSTQDATGATQTRILKGLIIAAIKDGRIRTEYSRTLKKTSASCYQLVLPRQIENDWKELCQIESVSPTKGIRHLIWSAIIQDGILRGYQ
jgi:hypothetical protein